MSPVVGVDGGGTRTRALLLADDGRELGSGVGPEGIATERDPAAAVEGVERAVRAAAEDAGVALPLRVLCCGLAGIGSDDLRHRVRSALEGRGLARRIVVTTDVEVAFRDAFGPVGTGILVVSGTGSVALGRVTHGPYVRVGGWGSLLDDAGSAYWLGLRALQSVLRAFDGRGRATDLEPTVLSALGVGAPPSLVGAVARASKAEIGALAPLVSALALDGDPVAAAIVDEAVEELMLLTRTVVERLPVPRGDGSPVVALTGGVVASQGLVRTRLRTALERNGLTVLGRAPVGARGAAAAALEAAGPTPAT